jgi:1,4-dihydroxy-2-naphthoate polyprenyltransferase
VAFGSAASYVETHNWHGYRILLCFIVGIAIQIAVNYSNDYSDGIRGTDKFRVGPPRLTGSGGVKPRTVLVVAVVFFAIAGIAGVVLVILTQQWWLFAVGAAALLAGWFYTGGKRPYGYLGLGEIFVFLFFGLVATCGTTFVQVGEVSLESLIGGIALGFIACAVLMVNNLRDREQDNLAGKRTLSTRIGNTASRVVFAVFLLLPFVLLGIFVIFYTDAFYVYFALLAALPAVLITFTAKTPRELIIALQLTSLTALAFGIGLGAAIAF